MIMAQPKAFNSFPLKKVRLMVLMVYIGPLECTLTEIGKFVYTLVFISNCSPDQ